MRVSKYQLEQLSERWFRVEREEFAAMLAAGETLAAFGKPYLSFENLEDRLFDKHQAELATAMQLCAISPDVGGKHVKKILESAALDLIDDFKDGFRASYEEEINQRDAA